MRVYRDIYEDGQYVRTEAVYDLMEATYNAQDMSKRVVTASIKTPSPIGFKLGDYVIIQMQTLRRDPGHNRGEIPIPADSERFYIYTEPQCRKNARAMSDGEAFETTVSFYPRQYELSCIQMRDFIQARGNNAQIIYTGFDSVTFYGGARELLDRCMACMAQHYKDDQGQGLWNYELADSLNEDLNNALERYTFSFQGNSVMDALLKLNDKDFINTTFFINGRTIYVGFERPYFCSVNNGGSITDTPMRMMYGKTSHLSIDKDFGGLFNITKSVGEEIPITKLFAYGAARNLNRYYCSDRISSGRFVNKLMLPSFSDDGETDYIISDTAEKYGINEGSKNFDEIYPSLRYMTYADIRGIKYCIKVRTSGLTNDRLDGGIISHDNTASQVPMARVQCYKVVPCTGENTGRNTLVECAPPEDLAVFIHATGKTVKVLLMADKNGQTSVQRQLAHDFGHVPTRDGATDYIVGSCFCVHDNGFADMDGARWDDTERQKWFEEDFRRYKDTDSIYPENVDQQRAELHRIEYVDTFWLTDLYVMEYNGDTPKYDTQRSFKRDGYSAWAWPRLNNESTYPDNLLVNQVVAVEPVVIADTSDNVNAGRQQHFDIYLRDIGFAIDEQNDFGEMVFVFQTPVVSVLDGILAGREFTIDGGENLNNFQERVVCAYNEDGSFNPDFLFPGDSSDDGVPRQALQNGAVWRIRLNRNDQDSELSSIGMVIPNIDINMEAGDHIVLLDIYMPDIYIRAAEQRLLREAKWYLEKNDKGNVKYAIALDQVRFNQIRNYALQMREGLRIRMEDADLNISSTNVSRMVVDHSDIPVAENIALYHYVQSQPITEERTPFFTFYNRNTPNTPKFADHVKVEEAERTGYSRISFSIPKTNNISVFDSSRLGEDFKIHVPLGMPIPYDANTFSCYDDGYHYNISFEVTLADFGVQDDMTLIVQIPENVTYVTYEKEYIDEGISLPACCRDYVRFKAGKHYDVIVDLQVDPNAESADEGAYYRAAGVHGDNVKNDHIVLTVTNGYYTTIYSPDEYTKVRIGEDFVVDGKTLRRYKYSFRLPDSFTEGNGYYVGFYYFAPDNDIPFPIEFGTVRMVSVEEKDLNEEGDVVNYVDFVISDITIKIQDNSRPADQRILPVSPEAIYNIEAQIEEQTNATSWGTLMNTVEKNRIEQEQTKRTYEMLANIARQNSQNLLNLRGNIFDPDGTCNDVFLQVMMLQVGADSMNYQLDYTYTRADGRTNNFTVGGRNAASGTYDHFKVFDKDNLHHFVYTLGGNPGTWEIPGNFDYPLAPNGTDEQGQPIWPVYYVCIKCKKDGPNDLTEPAWKCSEKQYAVNDIEDTDYWYFNWGILTPDSNGNYTLTETRGNAYMYGDNIVAGKISAIANNSYFDLTHGNFVLSKEGPDGQGKYANGMTYINNKLTIWGLNDEEGIGKAIKDLQLEEIGGENLYSGLDPLQVSTTAAQDTDIILENGEKYVISIETIDGNAFSLLACEKVGSTYSDIGTIITGGSIGTMQHYEKKSVVVTGSGGKLSFKVNASGPLYYYILTGVMVQKGTKATSYSTYYHHLTDALKGSTDIVGGLTMTNLLMLKDNSNPSKVVAGMSGLPDDSTVSGEESYGVTLWSGGSYEDALTQAQAAAQGTLAQLQTLLPILLTKNGPGSRIGCFNVDSENQVSIIGSDNTSKFIFNTGTANTGAFMSVVKNNVEVIRVTTDALEPEKNIYPLRSFHYDEQYNMIVTEDEDLTNKKAVIESVPFVGGNLYGIAKTSNATYLMVEFYLGYSASRYSNKIQLSFDVYLAGKKIGTIGTDVGEYTETGFLKRAKYPLSLPNIWSYAPPRTGNLEFDIRNISITDADSTTGKHPALSIKTIAIGDYDGSDYNTWLDGEIRLYSSGIKKGVSIGSNGISMTGNAGTNFSFLDNNGQLKFYAYGLQRGSGNISQITRARRDWNKFKRQLMYISDNWPSFWNVSGWYQQALKDLHDATPDSIDELAID